MEQKQNNRYTDNGDKKYAREHPNNEGTRRSRGNHNRSNQTTGSKFYGINQDELKGIVISDEISTPTSQQYDALYEALIVYGGTRNSHVKTALRRMKPVTAGELSPPKPSPSEYTTKDEDEKDVEDTTLRKALYDVWTEDRKAANKMHRKYEEELSKLFGTIIGQLNTGIYDHVKGNPDWERADGQNDTLALLRILREVCYRDNIAKMSPAIDLANKMTKFLTTRQEPNKSPAKYVEEVKIRFDVLKSAGGSVLSKQLITYTLAKIYPDKGYDHYRELDSKDHEKAEIHKAAENLFVAAVIIKNSNPKQHRNIAQYLADQYAMGNDWYPTSPTNAQDLLNQYRTKKERSNSGNNNNNGGRERHKNSPDRSPREKETNATNLTTKGESATSSEAARIEEAKQLLMRASNEEDLSDDELCFFQITEEVDESTDGGGEGKMKWSPNDVVPQQLTEISNIYDVGKFPRNPRSASNGSKHSTHDVVTTDSTSARPSDDDEEHILLAQPSARAINEYWVLLDSQATCNVVSNPKLLSNIRKHPEGKKVIIHCNAGSVTVDTIGNMKGFGPVWFHPDGIANVLSLALVSDRFRITLDTETSQAFYVHKRDGSYRRFNRTECGLYACDMTASDESLFVIKTVAGQKEMYSELDVKRAARARKLQETLGFPSLKAFTQMIDRNLILNCPVTRRDIFLAQNIYGINPNIVKGKTVRKQPGHVREEVDPIPPEILKNYGNVTLAIDVYHVNGIKFLRTISRHLKFRTSRAIRDAKDNTIFECLKAVQGLYTSRGFKVTQIFGDNEFESLSDRLRIELGIAYHSVARGSHEPFVERDNRTSKERVRCMYASLPFKRLPRRITIELVNAADFWLNYWCSSGGVSKTIPPREMMTGVKLDVNKHARFQFGDYVLAHNESDNTIKPRASDAIYLRPTGSASGGFYVFDLKTGRRVHRQTATLAHMTNTIIKRVEDIAKEQNAPIGVIFGDINNSTTILDLDEADEQSDDDASDGSFEPDDSSIDSELTGVEEEPEDNDEDDMDSNANENVINNSIEEDNIEELDSDGDDMPALYERGDNEGDEPVDEDLNEATESEHSQDAAPGDEPETGEPNDTDGADDKIENDADDNDGPATEGDNTEAETTVPPRRMALRPSVTRSHNKFSSSDGFRETTRHRSFFTAGFSKALRHVEAQHQVCMVVASTIEEYSKLQSSQVTPQYGVQKGIKIFGDDGVKAVLKELQQLHDLNVISPCNPRGMKPEDIKKALPYLMFLKRKRCGKVKGRGCADGRPQREFISRDDASSPTVNLYALVLSCLIDAIENRHVATADIPGAFLQTDMPEGETVHIRLDGAMAELLERIDPDTYSPHIITTKKGNKILYAKANKAIYGTLRAALLFWENLSGKLQEWGFETNPYDKCTVNKIINGKQCTVMWHVDDLKISHAEESVVDDILNKLDEEYGKNTPLSVTKGKVHEYLGMTIDFTEPGKVKFSMMDYLEDTIANLPEDLRTTRNTTTPAADHLFEVNPDCPKLERRRADLFHHYVAKLLFAAKRARPDIQTAIAFLCTRVKQPDEDDWKKLTRVLGYIKDTIFLPLILGYDRTGNLYWYVDASFAVHNNMRSHTGGVLTLGSGAVMSMSTKQKLNTKSSTEAELVGVDDVLPFNMWCYHFLQWQGRHSNGLKQEPDVPSHQDNVKYVGHSNILYQDNTSSIRLETNGKASSTKRTRHINIRYFLVTDKVKRGDLTIQYCPTEEMIADYLTKPLQGSLFRRFRNTIMGVNDAKYLDLKMKYEDLLRERSSNASEAT